MATAPRNTSYWMDSSDETDYPGLVGDRTADVVVVGGGITGLTTALLLTREGVRVTLLEAGSVCGGTTGFTTGKVTSQHGLMYDRLRRTHGLETAQVYAAAQQAAIAEIASIVERESIDCHMRWAPALVYTELASHVSAIAAEVTAALACGLPARQTSGDIGLPWPVESAVRFDDQLLFHPRRYCLGLTDRVVRHGGRVFEHTRATAVDEEADHVMVRTQTGSIRADAVVLATQIPFDDRGAFFARTVPRRSYVVAWPEEVPPGGMYIAPEQPTRSIRPHFSPDGNVILLGGGGHGTGRERDTGAQYADLVAVARTRFGTNVTWQWSAQDFMPADELPFIGRITASSRRTFVATGFLKWGMTNGTVAAMLIRDEILRPRQPVAADVRRNPCRRDPLGTDDRQARPRNCQVGSRRPVEAARQRRPGPRPTR